MANTGSELLDVETMSIKALKARITAAGLSYADCIEKSQLRERAREAIAIAHGGPVREATGPEQITDAELKKPRPKPSHAPSAQAGPTPSSATPKVDAEGEELSFGSDEDCSICLDSLQDPVKLPCGHWFCKECIQGLRQSDHVQDLCPKCREPLPPGPFQLFDEGWHKFRRVFRQAERLPGGWANLPDELQKEMAQVCDMYGQSAAEGNAEAQFNLGVIYH